MAIKTAKVEVVMFDVNCPYCEGDVTCSNGSYNWDISAPEDTSKKPYECELCGEKFRLPKAVRGQIRA